MPDSDSVLQINAATFDDTYYELATSNPCHLNLIETHLATAIGYMDSLPTDVTLAMRTYANVEKGTIEDEITRYKNFAENFSTFTRGTIAVDKNLAAAFWQSIDEVESADLSTQKLGLRQFYTSGDFLDFLEAHGLTPQDMDALYQFYLILMGFEEDGCTVEEAMEYIDGYLNALPPDSPLARLLQAAKSELLGDNIPGGIVNWATLLNDVTEDIYKIAADIANGTRPPFGSTEWWKAFDTSYSTDRLRTGKVLGVILAGIDLTITLFEGLVNGKDWNNILEDMTVDIVGFGFGFGTGWAGGKMGALIGSAFGPAGSAIGFIIGGVVGGAIGSIVYKVYMESGFRDFLKERADRFEQRAWATEWHDENPDTDMFPQPYTGATGTNGNPAGTVANPSYDTAVPAPA